VVNARRELVTAAVMRLNLIPGGAINPAATRFWRWGSTTGQTRPNREYQRRFLAGIRVVSVQASNYEARL